jgi:hypothetical protein
MSGLTSMHRVLWLGFLAVALCAPLAGCRTPLERAWGVSQHAHVAQSIVDPDAGVKNRDTARTDGASTSNALTKMRTHETKVEKSSSPVTLINMGGGGGGQ